MSAKTPPVRIGSTKSGPNGNRQRLLRQTHTKNRRPATTWSKIDGLLSSSDSSKCGLLSSGCSDSFPGAREPPSFLVFASLPACAFGFLDSDLKMASPVTNGTCETKNIACNPVNGVFVNPMPYS